MKTHMHNLSKPIPKQKGAVVILFVLALPFLLMMMALALDTGNLFILKTELQNAADACALSAGLELDGTSAQFNRAQAAGILAGNANKVNLQKVAVSLSNNSSVMFAQSLSDPAGSYITASTGSALSNTAAATYKYVKCSTASTINKLLKVPGLGANDALTAQAIASRVPIQSPCVLPVSICSSAITGATPAGMWVGGILASNGKGSGLVASPACNGTNGPDCACGSGGNCFDWAHFGSGSGNSAELANLLTGNNTCNINLTSQTVSQNVPTAGTFDEYNTRFGVQRGNNTVNPDFTGWGYTPATFPAKKNAYSDYTTQKTALTEYQGSLSGYTVAQPTVSNATQRRIGLAPVVNCAITGSQQVTTYACILMLNPIATAGGNNKMYLEYLGPANTGACAETGYAGGGAGPTVSALVQ
jgi:Flp pilus assembly protein TadG